MEIEKGLHEFYNPRRASLSILEKLKFKTQAGFAADDSVNFDNFKDAERLFIQALPTVKDEFLDSVSVFYDKINYVIKFLYGSPPFQSYFINLIHEKD